MYAGSRRPKSVRISRAVFHSPIRPRVAEGDGQLNVSCGTCGKLSADRVGAPERADRSERQQHHRLRERSVRIAEILGIDDLEPRVTGIREAA